MKKASKVLGIIGGVLAAISGIIFLGYGAIAVIIGNAAASDDPSGVMEGLFSDLAGVIFNVYGTTGLIIGLACIVGAVLGFIGAAKVKKSRILAGVLLIIAAVLSIPTVLGIIAAVLFIIAGIFAFVRGQGAQAPA